MFNLPKVQTFATYLSLSLSVGAAMRKWIYIDLAGKKIH